MKDGHHIVKQQIFNRPYLREYVKYSNHDINIIELDHYTHINLVHSSTLTDEQIMFKSDKLYDSIQDKLNDIKELYHINEDEEYICGVVLEWSLIFNCAKSKIEHDTLIAYCEILKKYSEED